MTHSRRGFLSTLSLCVAMTFIPSGCSTVEGLKSDVSTGYQKVTDSFSHLSFPDVRQVFRPQNSPVSTLSFQGEEIKVSNCPAVVIRPDLKMMTEFQDDTRPDAQTMVSQIRFVSALPSCKTEGDRLVMRLDLDFAGQTGPKARFNPNDKPSFAYPYFIAVTDSEGAVLSKEIFAVSISYNAQETSKTQTENLYQNMPKSSPDSYKVVIGFQLTPEQLAYNQSSGGDIMVSRSR